MSHKKKESAADVPRKKKESGADYIERHDATMRMILGEMIEYTGNINRWWTEAALMARREPAYALKMLITMETHLQTHIRVERSDSLRRVRAAIDRLDRERPSSK